MKENNNAGITVPIHDNRGSLGSILMVKVFMCSAALMGFVGVVAGAVGAHSVQPGLSAVDASSYETAVVYLFVHALALGVVALMLRLYGSYWVLKLSGWGFLGGTLLFSCSIIVRLGLDISFPFPLAPYGGMLLMLGWLALFIGGLLQ